MRERDLGMDREITRRDFLDGVAIGLGALAGSGLPGIAFGYEEGAYPPALTGMRGSAPGSYEVAHALRDGSLPATSNVSVDEHFDLVVVGAGISGLAAAYFHRKLAGPGARILILDNHDDFGGHARRNEFRPGGRLLLSNGGTWSIDSPFAYSNVAAGLFRELGIDPPALQNKCARPAAYDDLEAGCFFNKESFGVDRLVVGMPEDEEEQSGELKTRWSVFLAKTPLSAAAQKSILRIQCGNVDFLAGLSQAEKKAKLSRTSYRDFLLQIVHAHPDAVPFYQTRTHDLYGLGIDAVSALECWAMRAPGFQGMGLDRVPSSGLSFTGLGAVTPKEDYFFHYPDGNASVARLLVRSLVPGCAPGSTAEDIVTARVDYRKLDTPDHPVRVRLGSTVISARQSGSKVDVTYVTGKSTRKVSAGATILACWNSMIPHLCPQLPAEQKEALRYGVKVPLVYTDVSLRSAKAFHDLGVYRVACPGMFNPVMYLDDPTDIGGYVSPTSASEPVVLRMIRTPCQPGLSARDQQRAGRAELLATTFETFERNTRDQLARVAGPGGFDPARDIDAITVNRWPHGYAYEYNPLWDPDWPQGQRPCDIARKPFGRIAIANSDAAAAAYTDQAIDQAYRAVRELIAAG